jgi:hypothetical protein
MALSSRTAGPPGAIRAGATPVTTGNVPLDCHWKPGVNSQHRRGQDELQGSPLYSTVGASCDRVLRA